MIIEFISLSYSVRSLKFTYMSDKLDRVTAPDGYNRQAHSFIYISPDKCKASHVCVSLKEIVKFTLNFKVLK